jgi:hypothetical protein
VLPDGAFASFCFIVHILECIVRHLCHFIELNLVTPIDNNTSRRTDSVYLCSLSVAQGSVAMTLKKKHVQINQFAYILNQRLGIEHCQPWLQEYGVHLLFLDFFL